MKSIVAGLVVWLVSVPVAFAQSPVSESAPRSEAVPEITVYKSPTCGCCKKWISHLRQNGFHVVAQDVISMGTVKQKYAVPQMLRSCHTAVVNGYVIEGHVPAADIRRLLKSRPPLWGLAVPGMPIGSPGMEQGNQRQPYGVLSVDRNGQVDVFSLHNQ